MVDQEYLRLRSTRRRILWHHVVVFTFLAVFGYFLNMMSTDLVVSSPPPIIDSIDDHLSKAFNHVDPLILKDMHYSTLMQLAPPSTPIGRLYARAMVDPKHNVYTANSGDPSSMAGDGLKIIDQICEGNRTLLLHEAFVLSVGNLAVCLVKPNLDSQFHIASEKFGHGYISGFWSKLVQGRIRSYIEYRYRTVAEFGRMTRDIRLATELGASSYFKPIDWKVLVCENNMESDPIIPFLYLNALRKTFNMYFAVAALATCFLIIELVGHRSFKWAQNVPSHGPLFVHRQRRVQMELRLGPTLPIPYKPKPTQNQQAILTKPTKPTNR